MATIQQLIYQPVVQDQASGPLRDVAQAADRTGAAVEQLDQRVTRTTQSFAAIEARLDPVARAAQNVERATGGVTRAMEAAERAARAEGVSQEQLARTLAAGAAAREQAALRAVRGLNAEQQAAALTRAGYAQLAAQVQATAAAQSNLGVTSERFAQANDAAASSSSRLGAAVGQVGFQLSDFATQIAMGQSAAVAFGVQFAQLAGFFGVGGAIAGAVVTVGLLGAQFLGLTDSTDTLARAVDSANDGFERMNSAAERRLRGLEQEADAVLRLANEYRAMGLAQAGGEAAGIERQGAALNLEAGRMRDALQGQLGSMQRRVFLPDGSRGDQFGLGDLGLSEGIGQFGRLRDLITAVEGSAGSTTGALRELANEANNLARAGGSGASEFGRLRDAALELLPAAQRLDEAQRNVAVQTLAVMQAMGQGSEQLQAYASRFGALSGEILRTAQSLAALRRDAVDIPGDRLRVEAQRAEEVLRIIRAQGQEAGQAAQDRFTREDQIAQRVSRLTEETRRALDLEGRSREDVNEILREQQGEFVTLATRAVDASRAVEEGLRRQGAAAREAAADFGMLRMTASGILISRPDEERTIAEINRLARGTSLDPARFRRDDREAAQAAEQARREVERFESQSRDAFARIGENALDRIGTGLVNAFTSGQQAALDFGSLSRSVLASVATDLIRLGAINPFTNAVFGTSRPTLGGALGGAGAAAGAAGGGGTLTQATGFLGLGRLFGGTSFLTSPGALANTGVGFLDRTLNTSIGFGVGSTPLNPGDPGSYLPNGYVMGTGPGAFTIGNALGGVAGLAGGAFSLYSGLNRGGIGGIVQSAGGLAGIGAGAGVLAGGLGIGGAVGGALAAAAPFLGPVALIAGILGSLLPGQRPSGREQGAMATLGTNEFRQFGLEGSRFSQQQRDQAVSIVRSIMEQEDAIAGRVGFGAAGQVDVRVIGGRGEGPGVVRGRIGTDPNAWLEAPNTQDGLRSFAEQTSDALFRAFQAAARDNTGDRASIVRASGSLQELEQNLQWFETTYAALTDTIDQTAAWARQLRELRTPYDEAIDRARQLGLAESLLVQRRDEAIQRAEAQRARDVQGVLFGLDLRLSRATNDNPGLALAEQRLFDIGQQNEAEQFREQLRNMALSVEQVTYTMEVLARVQQAEAQAREQAMRQAEAQARSRERQAGAQEALPVITSLSQFAAGLGRSEFSPFSASEQYSRAAAAFRDISARAGAGDAAAIRELQGASEAFLSSSRAVFGSGAQSVRDFSAVTDAIANVVNLGEDRLTSAFYAETTRQQTDRVVDELRQLRTEIAQLRLQPARLAAA